MIDHTLFKNIRTAVSAYSAEAYTNAKKLSGTGIISTDTSVDPNAEGFIGQLRWDKPLNAVINVLSATNAANGTVTDIVTALATYIKTARSSGAQQVNISKLISGRDGLQKMGNDFVEIRTTDEHNAILSVLRGVAAAEVAMGTGITSFDSDGTTGMFVDVNGAGLFGAAATGAGDARRLFDNTQAGAARGQRLFRAIGAAWKDYEPDFAYMVTSPETLAEMRAANLVDQVKITDGQLTFETILGGKFRLLVTRANQGNLSAHANVNDQSTKTTLIVKPGAISFTAIGMPDPVGIERREASYNGGGDTAMWFRWGYIAHPWGYDYVGAATGFATDAMLAAGASWARKVDPLNSAVLPILHA